ncbi:hypothetical protein TNCV_3639071 [Trichonephila clavipes]|nr:hypothetical protein TNCV_3639071 [Trichonephila clavipes]
MTFSIIHKVTLDLFSELPFRYFRNSVNVHNSEDVCQIRIVGWRRGLQILAGLQSVVSFIAILYRPVSLYHPQRRAILHIKSLQKRSKAKEKSHTVEKRPFIDFSVLKSKTVQIFVLGSGITAFGISSPFVLMVEEMQKDNLDLKSMYQVQVYLGLAVSVGTAAFGFIVIKNSAQCMIAKQYLCQGAAFILSGWLLAYPTLAGFYGYVLFVWVYGIFYGGYLYTLKLCVFEKVRARNYARSWSFLLWAQAIPSFLGLPTIWVGPQHAPRPFLLAGHKSLSRPPSSYLRITHHNRPEPSGPTRHNSLSNIWTHLSITPPVSIIPFSQHQRRQHDSLKTGFAYCQWGVGSPLPLWWSDWMSSLPEFRQ